MIALPTRPYYGFTIINLLTDMDGWMSLIEYKKRTKHRLYTADSNLSKHLQAVRKSDHSARNNDHPAHENLL